MIKLLRKLLDWWEWKILERTINKEIDSNINRKFHKDQHTTIIQDEDIQQKYNNGMTLLKQRVKDLAKDCTLEELLDKLKGEDLLDFAKDEDEYKKQHSEDKALFFVHKHSDNKSEQEITERIASRIADYYKLHLKIVERELLREARRAYQSGNFILHETLTKQWKEKYGKYRNN